MSLFWLTVVAVTSVYAAPLVTSARGRGLSREAGARAKELTTTAMENGRTIAHNTSAGVQRLAGAATETGRDTAHGASVGAQRLANTTTETGRAAANNVSAGAQGLSNAVTEGNMIPQIAKDKAVNLSEQAQRTDSHVSGAASGTLRQAQQIGSNATHKTSDAANSVTTNAKQYTSSQSSNNSNSRVPESSFERDQPTSHTAANRGPDASHSQTTPTVYVRQQPSVVSTKPV